MFSRYQESKLSGFWIAIKLGKIEGGNKLLYFNKNCQALRLKTHTKSRLNFLIALKYEDEKEKKWS